MTTTLLRSRHRWMLLQSAALSTRVKQLVRVTNSARDTTSRDNIGEERLVLKTSVTSPLRELLDLKIKKKMLWTEKKWLSQY